MEQFTKPAGEPPPLPPSVPLVEWFTAGAWHAARADNFTPEMSEWVAECQEAPQGQERRKTFGGLQYRCVWSIGPKAEPPAVAPQPPAGPSYADINGVMGHTSSRGIISAVPIGVTTANDTAITADESRALADMIEAGGLTQGDIERNLRAELRDRFALAALPAIIGKSGMLDSENQSRLAYKFADAMLKERDKPKAEPRPLKVQVLSYGATNLWLDMADTSAYPEVAKMMAARVVGVEFVSGANRFRITEVAAE